MRQIKKVVIVILIAKVIVEVIARMKSQKTNKQVLNNSFN